MKSKVYIAAASEYFDRAQLVAEALKVELGDAIITSRWHTRPAEKYPADDEDRARRLARNIADLDAATVLVALCDAGTPRSTFAEAGYALGRGIPVVWVSGAHEAQRCVFDAHPLVRLVTGRHTLPELVGAIARAIERETGAAA